MSRRGETAAARARCTWMMLARMLALHAAIGFAAASVFVAALLLADPGGIGALLHPARAGLLPLGLLWLFSGLTFSGAQFGAALGRVAGDGAGGSLAASPWGAARLARAPALARAARRSRGR